MRIIFAFLIYFLVFVVGLLAFILLRRRLLAIPFVTNFVYNPSLYFVFVGYYLLISIYILSLFLPVSGTPQELETYRGFRFVLSIIVAIASILYGMLWLIQLLFRPF